MRLWLFALAFASDAVSSRHSGAVMNNQPAWNGYVTTEATHQSAFTPFYVPPGSRAYDSASPFVHYSGQWFETYSNAFVGNSVRRTNHPRAAVTFTFTGTGVEWFGSLGDNHGIAKVFVDGKLIKMADTWSDVPQRQQRLFAYSGVEHGKHTLKIVNTGKRRRASRGHILEVDAFVVASSRTRQEAQHSPPIDQEPSLKFRVFAVAPNVSGDPSWTLTQRGVTGVHAMQLAIISATHALIVDKVEHNPLTIDGHPAWAALYNLDNHDVRPLRLQSNSFCAGGSFLGNGTLVNVGGNPIVEDHTSAADFGDVDGLQAVRILEPCDGPSPDLCNIYEHHERIRMAKPRWYNTVVRISDGSAMIIGGSIKGGWINNASTNNPTIEYWPPKLIHGSNGLPIHMPFLDDTLNSNLFPIAFALPDGKIFVAANRDAMIYDWKNNQECRLPQLPNGVRVTYPMTGTGVLLPLMPETNYTPEVLLCGGSSVDDHAASYELSSQDPASSQCSRMVLTDAGISGGWQVEQMPQPRVMLDSVLLPTGEVLFVNGAGSGIAGYGNVRMQVGASNADHPVLTPTVYDPQSAPGSRFNAREMPKSNIPRLYHSVASLTPRGAVMIAGSNPNLDRSEVEYGTEYRVEWLEPPYMKMDRPRVMDVPKKLGFGKLVKMGLYLPRARGRDTKGTSSDISSIILIHARLTHSGAHGSWFRDAWRSHELSHGLSPALPNR